MSAAPQVELVLHGPIRTVLWRLSAPNVYSNALITLVTICDAWFIGQLGTTALASLALVFPFQMLMQMFGNGALGGGIASALSRALGARQPDQAAGIAWHALLLGLIMSALFMLVLGLLARPVFGWLGGTGDALEGAVAYAQVAFGFATASWLFFVTFAICRGSGDMKTPALALTVSTLAQIGLSGCLTLGLGPFPALGIVGPAVALVVCQGGAGLALLVYAWRGRLTVALRAQALRWAPLAAILRVGMLSMVNSITIVFAVVVVTGLIGHYGTRALGGYGLGSRLELMLVPIAFGIGGALTTAVGINIGAGQHARARIIARRGAMVALILISPIGLALAVWPSIWLTGFTQDPAAFAAGALYLEIVAPFYGVFVAGQTLYFASQGTGQMRLPVLVGVIRLAIVVMVGLGATRLGLSLWTVFAGVSVGMVTVGIGMWLCTHSPAWRGPKERA